MTKKPPRPLELPHPVTEFYVSVYNGRVDVAAVDTLAPGGDLTPDDAERLAENLRAAAAYARLHPGKPPKARTGPPAPGTVDAMLLNPTRMQARIADMMSQESVLEQVLRERGTAEDGQPVRYLTVTTMDPT